MGVTLITAFSSIGKFRGAMFAQGKAEGTIQNWCGLGRPHNLTGKLDPHAGIIGKLCLITGDSFIIRDLRPEHLDKLFAEHASAGSHNRCFGAVSAYLRWAADNRYLAAARREELMKGRKTVPYTRGKMLYLTVQDYDDMIEVAGAWHPQRRALVALAWNALFRESEIKAATLGGLDRAEHKVKVYRTKQKEDFEAPISPTLDHEIFTVWLPYYAEQAGYDRWQDMVREHPDWPVIPRLIKRGQATGLNVGVPYRGNLANIVKELLSRLGVEWSRDGEGSYAQQGMHMFRRSAARELFIIWSGKEGGNRAIFRVSLMLGHKNITTTMTYIGYDPEREALYSEVSEEDPFNVARRKREAEQQEMTGVTFLAEWKSRKVATL